MVKVVCKFCEEGGKENVVYTDGKDEPLMYAPCIRHRRTISKDKVLSCLRRSGASNTEKISKHANTGIGSVRRRLKELLEEKSIRKLYGYRGRGRFVVYVMAEDFDRYLGKETKEYGKLKTW